MTGPKSAIKVEKLSSCTSADTVVQVQRLSVSITAACLDVINILLCRCLQMIA